MDRTCCPSYTIRLNASDFVPSKEQQRVSKRMQRYLQVAPSSQFPDAMYFPYKDASHTSMHIYDLLKVCPGVMFC